MCIAHVYSGLEIWTNSSSSFKVQPNTLYWTSNYEKTRWFLVFSVQKPTRDYLNCLLKLSNDALDRFGQPPLYVGSRSQETRTKASSTPRNTNVQPEDFSGCFHISLAWTLSAPSSKDREKIAQIDMRALRDIQIGFDSVKAKIGNIVKSIPLDSDLI